MRTLCLFVLTALSLRSDQLRAQATQAPSSPPNILFVFIDDMGWGDFSCFGNDEARTPHVDRLASEGIRFHQFYVASPICSPSRVAVSTGQYPYRWGITSYLANRKENARRGVQDWLSLEAPMLARILQSNGYATGHFGKWHMGGQRDVADAPLITEYGFDRSLTNFEGLGHRILPLRYTPEEKPPGRHGLGSDQLGHGPIEWEDRSIITGLFAQHALDFMKESVAEGKPFYVNLWPDDMHTPLHPPLKDWGDGERRTLYHAVLENMDHQLSRLFLYVRRTPELADNTLILICSDNGPEVGCGSPGAFRGSKATLFEAGIRSPLIAWGPGLLEPSKAGTINDKSVVSSMDLPPTLLALAEVPVPAGVRFDGEELVEVFTGKSESSREAPLYFRRPPDREHFRHFQNLPDLAVRSGEWKLLCEYDGSNPQLYRIISDPSEARNVAQDHPEVVRDLSARAIEWNSAMPQDEGPELGKAPPRKNPGIR